MRLVPLLPLAAALLVVTGCAAHGPALRVDSPYRDLSTLAKGEILHAATGRLFTEDELFEYLAPFSVVYVGESHDNADDHAVQLKILKALTRRFPGRIALGLEMLQRPAQAKADAYIRGELDEKAFAKVWAENWSASSYADYRDILQYAREAAVPLLALNAGKEIRAAVRARGVDGLDPELAEELPEIHPDEYHRAVIMGILGGHSSAAGHSLSAKDLEAYYRVQVLWDETMAQSAAEFLKSPEGGGKRLVVFAGGQHVRNGLGIPRRLFLRVPLPYAIVDPYVNRTRFEVPREKLMEVSVPELPMPSADVYWSVEYRETEKVMLGISIQDASGKGVLVLGVMPGSPGEVAGLRQGDVIVSVDGKPVRESADLTFEVSLHRPGDVGALEVERQGQAVRLAVTYRPAGAGK